MSKKTIVGMASSYEGLVQGDWLWKQTPEPMGVWGDIQIQARRQCPDFLLLYNLNTFPQDDPFTLPWHKAWRRSEQRGLQKRKELDAATRSRLSQVHRDRTMFLWREPPLEEILPRYEVMYRDAQRYCGYVSGPDDFAPVPDYMPAIWYHGDSFRELNEMPPPQKNRRCSWITSGISRTVNHRKRLAFLKSLVESELELDVYGRDLPDWSQSYGQIENKAHALNPYYYNLAVENYAENDWYVSEKLWDSLLGWCLPIYYGGTAADKLLPPGSFLRLPSQDEKGLAYIKEVTSTLDAWHEAKEAIAEARQIILHELNLLAWLSRFVGKNT
ncbi:MULTISPECIES: glycosyltransferase family 10 [Spirulina sp. CCY15215]|uniref:glycosyltransferase family 10 domain-containing protein n=1 Tax=Spirulina sp. CCY15215 TaxID=2767591 RepID=UPI00194E9688|nr:glycosyltransferase family 10 [Spirulina major]